VKKYKIIACDLDGTLLNSKSQISDENLEAIENLADKGVFFVPASGRTISEIPKELINNEKVRYVIASNGAVVFDKKTNNKILQCISKEKLLKIYDYLVEYGAYISFRYDGRVFAVENQQSDEALNYLNVCGPHRECMKNAILKEDMRKFLSQIDYVEVFAVFFHTDEDKENCKEKILALGDLKIVDAWDYNIEIFNIKTGKGEALESLAQSIGVDIADTIAVGDSENDATMIEKAGMGLAMANGKEHIKSIANEVICDNDSHAIDYILKEYFDEKNKYIMF